MRSTLFRAPARHGHRRSRVARRSGRLSWWLIACFLLQPVLAYLTTPVLGHDVRGRTVTLCTLQGEVTVVVDMPLPTDGAGDKPCPALMLQALIGAAPLGAPPVMPIAVLAVTRASHGVLAAPPSTGRAAAYLSRAPPVV